MPQGSLQATSTIENIAARTPIITLPHFMISCYGLLRKQRLLTKYYSRISQMKKPDKTR